jgi:hypothetical protein
MTKQEIVKQFKSEYPILTKQVNDEIIELDQDEYDETIDAWSNSKFQKLTFAAEAEAKAQAKATAEGKLAALGLTTDDLRALGL